MRGLRILGGVVVLVVLLMIFWSWDWFIPLVDATASARLGHKVTIQHLHVTLGGSTVITTTGISIANPNGFPAAQPQFGQIDQLIVAVDVGAYIEHQTLALTRIEIDHPVFNIRQVDGRSNYTLPGGQSGGSGNPPQIGDLVINDGTASIIMPAQKSDFRVTMHTAPAPAGAKLFSGGEIVVTADGTYTGAPVTGKFVGGALLSLRDNSAPYPINLHVQNGSTVLSLEGTLLDPAHFGGAQLKLSLAGQNMANLYQLTGVPIPVTPPYSIAGNLDYAGGGFRLTNIAGRVGSSDLEGSIIETPASPRRQVTAVLASHQVDLTDLAGFLGATPGKASTPGQDTATKAAQAQAAARPNLLPKTPLNPPRLSVANIDLRYHGDHIINGDVPLDDVVVHLIIQNGRITLDPLNFAVGSGTIASNVDLNPVDGVLHATAKIDFRNLPLARLLAATHTFAGDGTLGGAAYVTGTGNSVAEIFGHGNGGAKLFLQHGGDISALLVDLAGLQFGDAVLSALGIPQKAPVNCIVSDFVLTNGQLDTKAFLVATTEANILGSGTADLTDETLHMALRTQATHISIGSFSTPINIGGTLKHPSVAPAAGPLAEKAGAAVALGILFPPLALIPTIRLGLGDKNACVDTLASVRAGTPHNPK
jgi:uncharacterized protein involved in outer membrane biogenesis